MNRVRSNKSSERFICGPLGLWVLLALLPFSAALAGGPIYRYVDRDGTVVYTNVPPSGARIQRVTPDLHPVYTQTSNAIAKPVQKLEEVDYYIEHAAIRYKIPPPLVLAIMHAESGFQPRAVSPVGASGLMQLMPATAQDMYVKDIFDVRQNIDGGVRYLRVLANEFNGDMVKIVSAYNAGPEAVRKANGRVPAIAETQAYVRKVLSLYFQYKEKLLRRDQMQARRE